MSHWQNEFGEEYRPHDCVLALLERDGVQDDSWHNDTCPHFMRISCNGYAVAISFEHPDPECREFPLSEFPDSVQYAVWTYYIENPAMRNEDVESKWLLTNDAEAAVKRFLEL